MNDLDELHHLVRRPRGTAAGALVLLHGRGTDERDLAPLLDALDPQARLTGVTLRAPLELAPGGYHWYVVRELGRPDPGTFMASYRLVCEWLDERLPAVTGTSLQRTVVGGFSQGGVMSYALGLGAGRPSPAALLAFSAYLPEAPGFTLDLEGHRGVPVAVGHGSHDGVIAVEWGREAVRRFAEAGFDVRFRESPMFHSIDPAFVSELSHWLPDVLRQRQAA